MLNSEINEESRLIWADIETTGFTELSNGMVYKHAILEISMVITDGDYNPIANKTIVIKHNIADYSEIIDDVVMKMHTENGLFAECETSITTLAEAEQILLQFLKDNGVQKRKSPLCGNTIYLDRAFIEAQMPELNAYIYYRSIDVSSLNEFFLGIDRNYEYKKSKNHRGYEDILESIAEIRSYKKIVERLRNAS